LLPGHRGEDVLRLCAALAVDPLPPVYRVTDGFLIKLPRPLDTPPAGVIRLRALSGNLLLPVDAELVPPLLEDEAAALVRRRGMIFLPGGRVLEYQPDEPLPITSLLNVGDVRRRPWQSLPEPPELAEDVTEIALEMAGGPPEALLQPGGADIATQPPQIEDANLPSKVVGRSLFQVGRSVVWLGKVLHLQALAGLGASAVAAALSLVPRLSEELLGRQEALLRNLLREFREGDVEKALSQALPLGDDAGRGSVPAQDAQLPNHDLAYSLANLLGGRGEKGPVAVWFGGGNTYQQLFQEYRKQAELAGQRGDFRRAAFICGKLLRDYRSAALVLARGGLHRDAAILYERKLRDLNAAAREWEAAGDVDRAVGLYQALGEHALAGDLLRRAGEEDRAVVEYQLAAAKLVESSRFYEAGELLATRAARPDLALPYFRRGWEARPQGSALPCAVRLAQHYAAAGEPEPLLRLTAEADEFLEPWDAAPAATFYNELARLAARPTVAGMAGELRDRARIGLARKLQSASGGRRNAGPLIPTLFPADSPWPVPVVRDAKYALHESGRRTPSAARQGTSLRRVRPSVVRAVHQAPDGEEVFLGLENGEVLCYRPGRGEVITVAQERGPILSLASHGGDDYLAVLSRIAPHRVCLSILSRSIGFRMLNYQHVHVDEHAWLCTHVQDRSSHLIGVCDGRTFELFRAPELVNGGSLDLIRDGEVAVAAVMGPVEGSSRHAWLLVLYPGGAQYHPDIRGAISQNVDFPWVPTSCGADTLAHPVLHATSNNTEPLEVMGLDQRGGVRLSCFWPTFPTGRTIGAWPEEDERFLAFARIRANHVAGVTRRGVHWLLVLPTAAQKSSMTPLSLTRPVAAFVLSASGELLIVEADCTLTRVPIREWRSAELPA
jgi:tetratricopeptide (TPR) repeat protein